MGFTYTRRLCALQVPEAAAAVVVRSQQGAARRGVRSWFTLACALAVFLDVIPEAWVATFPIGKQHRVVRVQRWQAAPKTQSADVGQQRMTFGKHKDRTFEDMCANEMGYITWMRGQDMTCGSDLIEYCDQQLLKKTASKVTRSRPLVTKTVTKKVTSLAKSPPPKVTKTVAKTVKESSAAPSSARTSPTTRSQSRQVPEAGKLNADIFELPPGLLKDRVVWSCPGNEWNRDDGVPGVWNMKGSWRFVSRVLLGKKLAINLEDSSQKPKGQDAKLCEKLDVSKKMTEEQYAKFVGAIMEEESRVDMCKPREIVVNGNKLEALPKLRIRGIVTDNKPHLAVVMEQELFAGPKQHLGGKKVSNHKTAAASMVGLKVRPLGPAQPWFSGLVICDPEDDDPMKMTAGEQKRLLKLTKTKEIREATKEAAVDELLLHVSKNCTNVKDLRMTFPANALRPSLTGAAQENRLRKMKGWENWKSIPPAKLIVKPSERQDLIEGEISRLSNNLRFAKVSRMSADHLYHRFQPPNLVSSQGAVPGDQSSTLMSRLHRQSAFHIEKQAPDPVRLHYVVVGEASQGQKDLAKRAREDIWTSLNKAGVKMSTDKPEVKFLPTVAGDKVQEFFKSPEIRSSDAVLIFATSNLWASNGFYDGVKWECLIKGRGNTHHTASQAFDLSKQAVWSEDSRGYQAAVKITATGLLAKLGHVPWALDISGWFQGGRVPDPTPVVIGYDVCHLTSPKGDPVHVAAGIQVHNHDDSSHLSRIGYRIERVKSETVPAAAIRRIVPPELARGRLVIIHRDGEFPHAELKALKEYHSELSSGKNDGTCFVLVECVKWAGKAPRLYLGTKTAEVGSMLALNANDTLIVSSAQLWQGTANPINARLADILGQLPPGLTDFFWSRSIFDLSYLHHGSVMKKPRLPVTTHFADRLAYVLANAGKDWDKELASSKGGYQQFWL